MCELYFVCKLIMHRANFVLLFTFILLMANCLLIIKANSAPSRKVRQIFLCTGGPGPLICPGAQRQPPRLTFLRQPTGEVYSLPLAPGTF